ncbi:MAG: hypothetical protein HYU64_07635 [Armatimonadetes bacterium]|nr:hypothetical protein [Armatimonadota bacterium]
MTNDPIVQEVRKIRHEIEQECQQDPDKYYQHLKALQEKLAGRLASHSPKPLAAERRGNAG